jgi:hypothetical protein
MNCPSCKGTVKDDEWLCPYCEHILDLSVLGVDDDAADGATPRAEITKSVAWDPGPERSARTDDPPDAMILGEVGVAEKDFNVVAGAAAKQDGRTSTFLFYTSGATSRIIHPDATVKRTRRDATIPRTPYEDFILSLVDGVRSVRQIQRTSGLAPQEVVITLLTLLDKGAISIDSANGISSAPRRSPLPAERETKDEASPFDKKQDLDTTEPPDLLAALDRRASGRDALDQAATVDGFPIPAREGAIPEDDLEDLPSVRDFEEIESTDDDVYEEESPTAEIFEGDLAPAKTVSAPPPLAKLAKSEDELVAPSPEGSKVVKFAPDSRWSSDSPMPELADDLIEREQVVPSDLESSDSEMITDHGVDGDFDPSASSGRHVRLFKDPSEAKERARTPAPGVVPGAPITPPPLAVSPTPVPPVLDTSFLVEMPKSVVAENPKIEPTEAFEGDKTPPPHSVIRAAPPLTIERGDEDSRPRVVAVPSGSQLPAKKQEVRRPLTVPIKRAAIEERDRRKEEIEKNKEEPGAKKDGRATKPKPKSIAFTPKGEAQSIPAGAEGARMLKAQKLYEEALKDKAEGNLLSARMNMKLALTFDPQNSLYEEAFEELQKMGNVGNASTTNMKNRARELYDLATQKEEIGDVDEAIALLEKAIKEAKEPAFYNRLGVILATKKHEFARAQQLIELAIDMAPNNTTYQHNLGKVLSMAATRDMSARNSGPPSGGKKAGILGLLGRKK